MVVVLVGVGVYFYPFGLASTAALGVTMGAVNVGANYALGFAAAGAGIVVGSRR